MRYIKTDWYQWLAPVKFWYHLHDTHTPVYWCKLTCTGYWYQKTGQCVWPFKLFPGVCASQILWKLVFDTRRSATVNDLSLKWVLVHGMTRVQYCGCCCWMFIVHVFATVIVCLVVKPLKTNRRSYRVSHHVVFFVITLSCMVIYVTYCHQLPFISSAGVHLIKYSPIFASFQQKCLEKFFSSPWGGGICTPWLRLCSHRWHQQDKTVVKTVADWKFRNSFVQSRNAVWTDCCLVLT